MGLGCLSNSDVKIRRPLSFSLSYAEIYLLTGAQDVGDIEGGGKMASFPAVGTIAAQAQQRERDFSDLRDHKGDLVRYVPLFRACFCTFAALRNFQVVVRTAVETK